MGFSNQFSLKREPCLRAYEACFGSSGFVVRQYMPPGKKGSGEQNQIFWTYYVVRTNEIAEAYYIALPLQQ